MMSRIFLGKSWHWAVIALATALLWFFGSQRLHVIEFNLFILSMLAATALAVLAVVWFHRPGEQVTRDPLVAHDDDEENSAALNRD